MAMYQNQYMPAYGQNQYQQYQQSYQQPAQQQIPQQSNGYTAIPVTSKEEALAVPVDYFSLGKVMIDLNHGVVYLKRFNANTGASDFFRFTFSPEEQTSGTQQIAGLQQEDLQPIWDEINKLKEELEKSKGKAGRRNVSADE